jgi:phage tail sheath protein FI
MAVQVSYPGIYIDEFAPGAPIQGVGTSTAGFVGTALSGPSGEAVLVESWDFFEATFGGFIDEAGHYLAKAVSGFFRNGGTRCYVVRSSTGVRAAADLPSRGPSNPQPILVARALREGTAGNALSVTVTDSSLLAAMLAASGSPETTLAVAHAATTITTVDATRRTLTIPAGDGAGFRPNDSLLLTNGAATATAVVERVVADAAGDTIRLTAPIQGTDDFSGGDARIADLLPGQRQFRLVAAVPLAASIPAGSQVSITRGGTSEVHVVASAGGDVITVEDDLANTFAMDDPNDLPRVASLEFDLTVGPESYLQLSMDARHPRYWRPIVAGSELIEVVEPDEPPTPRPDDLRPTAGTHNLANGASDDRQAALQAIINNPTALLDAIRPVDEVAVVAVPGVTDPVVQQAVIEHCEQLADRFGVLDAPRGTDSTAVEQHFANVRSERGFGALYYPWIEVRNPNNGRNELWPPSGHVMGIYARTDQTRGVHKAPANTNIRGSIGLERRLSDDQQGPLNLLGVNVLRVFPGQAQPLVWGARTTATDRNWQYVNVRRLLLFIEESIQEGIRWAVFEPNNLELWGKLRRTITEFLSRVWRDGALFGATAEEAFYVRIDEALNPASTQALGRLYIEIGVRPTYPAEFIIVRIGIWRGGSEVNEA